MREAVRGEAEIFEPKLIELAPVLVPGGAIEVDGGRAIKSPAVTVDAVVVVFNPTAKVPVLIAFTVSGHVLLKVEFIGTPYTILVESFTTFVTGT